MAGRHARPTRAAARAGEHALQRQPRSERAAALKRAHLRKRSRDAVAGSSLLAGALVIGVLGGGGTFALWNGDSPLPADTVTAIGDGGEVSLRFAVGDPAASSASFTNLLPGESMTVPILLENDGDHPLDVSAELTGTTGSGYSLRLEIDDACTASGFLSSSYIGGSPLALSTPAAIGAIDDGDTSKLCVEVTASSGIVPSSVMTFDVTLSGDSGS